MIYTHTKEARRKKKKCEMKRTRINEDFEKFARITSAILPLNLIKQRREIENIRTNGGQPQSARRSHIELTVVLDYWHTCGMLTVEIFSGSKKYLHTMQNSVISQRNERTTKQMSLLDLSVLKTHILIMSGR